MTKQQLTFPITARTTADGGSTYTVTVTTNDTDRMGDVVVPGGAQTSAWSAAGAPVLYGHSRNELPIGRGLRLVPTSNGIRMDFQFLQGDEFAQRCENAWRQGALGAASIGFVPLSTSPLGNGGLLISEWDLLEVSLTPTPANPAAVRTLKALGLPVADDEVALVLREDRDVVLFVDDEPDNDIVCDVDRVELAALVQSTLRVEIAAMLQRETVAAINKMRGRID